MKGVKLFLVLECWFLVKLRNMHFVTVRNLHSRISRNLPQSLFHLYHQFVPLSLSLPSPICNIPPNPNIEYVDDKEYHYHDAHDLQDTEPRL